MYKFVPAALALLAAVVLLPAADPPKVEQTEAGKKRGWRKSVNSAAWPWRSPKTTTAFKCRTFFQTDGKFSDDYLAPLKELHGLVHLNLRGQPVTDAQLAMLKDLNALTELHLEKTKVTDKGLENLKGLTSLEST